MTGKAGFKAGLIGTAIMLIWTVIGRFVPMTGILTWVSVGISLLIYAGIGVMAGIFMTPPRTPGKGGGAGALAGLIGGVISGIVGIIIMTIQISSGGDIPGLDPQQMEQLAAANIDPKMLPIFALPGLVCVAAIGSGLAAIGGAIVAAVKPD